MNPSTVLCTHSCANGCLTKLQTLNHEKHSLKVKKAKAHSQFSFLTSAKTNLKIVQRQARHSKIRMNLAQRKRNADRWLSAKCLVTLNSSENWENWESYRKRFYIVASSNYWRRKGEGDPGGILPRISNAFVKSCVPAAVSLTRIKAADLWINISIVWTP